MQTIGHTLEYPSVARSYVSQFAPFLLGNGLYTGACELLCNNTLFCCAGTMELENDGAEKTGGLSNSSSGPSMSNCDPEDNISSLKELCIPLATDTLIFPSSAPLNAARQIKRALPGICKEPSDYKNDYLTSDAVSEVTESVQDMIHDLVGENMKILPTTQKDNNMVHSVIDPFWPFCMFELRGKCNDEECQWQHVEHHAWRKPKLTKRSMTSVSGLLYLQLLSYCVDYLNV